MSNYKFELSDEELENVTGGVRIENGYVENQDTYEKYKLTVDPATAFFFINKFGSNITEAERIEKLKEAGYIEY